MSKRSIPVSSLWYAGLVAVLLLLALMYGTAPARVSAIPGVSIKNFGKINDHYYRGSQPTQEEFAQLMRIGIKTVIDLRMDNLPIEAEWTHALGLKYFNLQMKASTPATEQQTSQFLALANDPANWPVYVHCKGGRHRTGAMTAVYRITQDGWTADQAYREMTEYDFNNGFFGGPGAQKKYVYAFYKRHRAAAMGSQK
jgi:protein tyrosine/serine phosphatase